MQSVAQEDLCIFPVWTKENECSIIKVKRIFRVIDTDTKNKHKTGEAKCQRNPVSS